MRTLIHLADGVDLSVRDGVSPDDVIEAFLLLGGIFCNGFLTEGHSKRELIDTLESAFDFMRENDFENVYVESSKRVPDGNEA